MRWRGRTGSGNVEDRRGMSIGGLATGGGVIGVILYLIVSLLGGDPSQLPIDPNIGQVSQSRNEEPGNDTLVQFVSVVLAETERAWSAILEKEGMQYQPPTLVLFTDLVQSGCGRASANTGPFYCPADRKLYIDLSFYQELRNRFGAPGDFAMAYVVAHEVGHHVQNLLGVTEQLDALRNRVSSTRYNQYSVMLELQADYYAGVWAHFAKQSEILEEGDIEEALSAASAVGDDNLQKQMGSEVRPESFTHGTSAQRMEWFRRGYQYGDLRHGDTFNNSL